MEPNPVQPNPPVAPAASTPASRAKLLELARLFFKLGATAFGGPAAHIALMQEEVVTRRGWLTAQEFLDMYAATNFIPGPNSTEMTIHIGYQRAGWPGLLVAGACFILPAALMCTALAAIYKACGQNPASEAILWGVKPVVIAIVGQALWRLAQSAIKTWLTGIVALLATAALLAELAVGNDAHELLVLFAAGVITAAARSAKTRTTLPLLAWPLAQAGGSVTATMSAGVAGSAPLLPLFLIFLKIGSVLFGSGYVLLAFLQNDFVDHRHWLTQNQLLDAVAVGQVTPGPVFTTATFIGYLVSGPWGALVATVGIFLPAFAFVAISAPLLPRLRKSPLFAAFLDGLNAGSLALMAVVLLRLTREALSTASPSGTIDLLALLIATISLAALLWKNVNSIWLLLAGAAVGVTRTWFFHKTGA